MSRIRIRVKAAVAATLLSVTVLGAVAPVVGTADAGRSTAILKARAIL